MEQDPTQATIAGDALLAFRARMWLMCVRAIGVSLPLLIASLLHFRQELTMVVLFATTVLLAAAYGAYRAQRNLTRPLHERFVISTDALIHYVGGKEVTRIRMLDARTAFQNRHAYALNAKGRQIAVPTQSEGFEPLVRVLTSWADISRPPDLLAQAGVRTGFFAILLVASLLWFGFTTGTWWTAALMLPISAGIAELAARLRLRSARGGPSAF